MLGMPAEEGHGGKMFLIESGVFADIDIAIMTHPAPKTIIRQPYLACTQFEITYQYWESYPCSRLLLRTEYS